MRNDRQRPRRLRPQNAPTTPTPSTDRIRIFQAPSSARRPRTRPLRPVKHRKRPRGAAALQRCPLQKPRQNPPPGTAERAQCQQGNGETRASSRERDVRGTWCPCFCGKRHTSQGVPFTQMRAYLYTQGGGDVEVILTCSASKLVSSRRAARSPHIGQQSLLLRLCQRRQVLERRSLHARACCTTMLLRRPPPTCRCVSCLPLGWVDGPRARSATHSKLRSNSEYGGPARGHCQSSASAEVEERWCGRSIP